MQAGLARSSCGSGSVSGSSGGPLHGPPGLMQYAPARLPCCREGPNRVCCNALLASYSHASPPQWQRAIALIDCMAQCAPYPTLSHKRGSAGTLHFLGIIAEKT